MKRRRKTDSIVQTAGRSLLVGGAAIAAIDLVRRAFRQSQLFCPETDAVKSWDPEAYGVPREAVDEVNFETPDGHWLYGWYCHSPRPIASAVFCHGNTGNLTTVAGIIPHLLDAGYNVLFFDYRGFGRSTGRPSVAGVIADGVTAARFHETLRPAHLPSILYGYSLGGAVAAQVIRHHHFDGLILQSTFTSLPDIARVTFPRLPLHLLAGNLFDTLSVIRHLQVPLLVIHGEHDEVIPCWMAHRIFDACVGTKRMHLIDGGLHKDLYVRDGDALVWVISQFVAELPLHAQHPAEPSRAVDGWIDHALRYVRRQLRRPSELAPKPL